MCISVLVVDDEELIRFNLVSFLEDEEFTVYEAASAEEALSIIESQHLDVGVIDQRLPGMDGNSFILKAVQKSPAMRFVIHTGSLEYEIPSQLRNIGIDDQNVLFKPIHDMKLLLSRITEVTC
jgi:CheY-like chemotaxis protein